MKAFYFLGLIFAATTIYGQKIMYTIPHGAGHGTGTVPYIDMETDQVISNNYIPGSGLSAYNLWISDFSYLVDNQDGLTFGSDGKIYGVSSLSTSDNHGRGIFYRFSPGDTQIEVLHVFNGEKAAYYKTNMGAFDNDLRKPVFKVTEGGNGVFYGVCLQGGTDNYGGLWKYNINTQSYSILASFNSAGIGINPIGSLVKAHNDDIYGACLNKGSGNYGYLFKINKDTDEVTFVNDLEPDPGVGQAYYILDHITGEMCYDPNNDRLYGVKSYSVIPQNKRGGGLFYYAFDGDSVRNEALLPINDGFVLGQLPQAVIKKNNTELFIITVASGAHDYGTLLTYNLTSKTFTKSHDFSHTPAYQSVFLNGTKLLGAYDPFSDNKLFWEYDFSGPTFTASIDKNVNSAPGNYILGNMAFDASNGLIYARTAIGGPGDAGYNLTYDVNSKTITSATSNNNETGRYLTSGLVRAEDSIFLAVTSGGGGAVNNLYNESGAIVKIDILNDTITHLVSLDFFKKKNLNNSSIIKCANGKFYFTSYRYQEVNGAGNRLYLMEYDYNTNQLTNILHFSGSVGVQSGFKSDLIQYEANKIAWACGDSLWTYDVINNNFIDRVKLFDFNTNGNAVGGLTLYNGKLFGSTARLANFIVSSPNDKVSIYSFDLNSKAVTVEYAFNNGIQGLNNRLSVHNNLLYSVALDGGANNDGYVLSFDPANGTMTNLYDLDAATDGGGFLGDMVYSDHQAKFILVSSVGGVNGRGTIATFDPINNAFAVLRNLDQTNGNCVSCTPLITEDTGTSIADLSKQDFSLYPNPTQKDFAINGVDYDMIKIYDLSGKMLDVQSKKAVHQSPDLQNGIYFIEVYLNNEKLGAKKLIVNQ